MTIGFVGTGGRIDSAVAALVASGHTVVTYAGGRWAAIPLAARSRRALTWMDLCHGAEVIVSSLDDDATLVEVVQAADGLMTSMARGATHVTLGMHAPATIARLSSAQTAAGQQFVAAPLLFQPSHQAGPIAIVAGPAAATEALAPLFQALGVTVFPAGDRPDVATTLSLAHAALAGSAVQAMAEAFALVRKYGVDPHVMHDVITDGLFRGSDVYKTYGAAMIDGPTHVGDVTVVRALQILDLVMSDADQQRVPLPAMDACRDRLLGALAHGDGASDWTVVNREQARASGLD